MRELMILAVLGLVVLGGRVASAADSPATRPSAAQAGSVLEFTVNNIDGKPVDLASYKGKVLLVVNTASKCGFTPQYADLEKVYETYKDKGLAILAFPANEFGGQEPGTNQQIAEFCSSNYHVSFDLFSKVVVKGKDQVPLYQFLTSSDTNPKFGGQIKWNFTKFLISRDGKIVNRFESKVKPTDKEVVEAIESELGK